MCGGGTTATCRWRRVSGRRRRARPRRIPIHHRRDAVPARGRRTARTTGVPVPTGRSSGSACPSSRRSTPNGWPLPLRTVAAERTPDGFDVVVPAGVEIVDGPAFLSFHTHNEVFDGQENIGLAGRARTADGVVHVTVDRALADWGVVQECGPVDDRDVAGAPSAATAVADRSSSSGRHAADVRRSRIRPPRPPFVDPTAAMSMSGRYAGTSTSLVGLFVRRRGGGSRRTSGTLNAVSPWEGL